MRFAGIARDDAETWMSIEADIERDRAIARFKMGEVLLTTRIEEIVL